MSFLAISIQNHRYSPFLIVVNGEMPQVGKNNNFLENNKALAGYNARTLIC